MKKYVWSSMLLLVFILFTGCASKPPSQDQLLEDIPKDFITLTLNGEAAGLRVTGFDLEKRRNEDEKSDIYGVLLLENEDYKVTADCFFQYIFYDEGGWILEECQVLDGQYEVELIDSVTQERADKLIAQYYEDYTFIESNTDDIDGADVYSFIYDVTDRGRYFSFQSYLKVCYTMEKSWSEDENRKYNIGINWKEDILEASDTFFSDWAIEGLWSCGVCTEGSALLSFDVRSFDGDVMDIDAHSFTDTGENIYEYVFTGEPEIQYSYSMDDGPEMEVYFSPSDAAGRSRLGEQQQYFQIHICRNNIFVFWNGDFLGEAARP